MAHFWKDLYEVERNSVKESWRFIMKHPIGYGLLVVASASIAFVPMMIDAVKDKVTETKIKESKKAKLEERVTKLESECEHNKVLWSNQIEINDFIILNKAP